MDTLVRQCHAALQILAREIYIAHYEDGPGILDGSRYQQIDEIFQWLESGDLEAFSTLTDLTQDWAWHVRGWEQDQAHIRGLAADADNGACPQ